LGHLLGLCGQLILIFLYTLELLHDLLEALPQLGRERLDLGKILLVLLGEH
jgi:hypothetical protein